MQIQVGSGAARSLAASVEAVADDVRVLAGRAEAASTTGWRSSSAEAFRERLAEQVVAVRVAAGQLDEAAAAVRQHAAAVDAVLESVGDVFGPVLGLAGSAAGTGVGTVRRLGS